MNNPVLRLENIQKSFGALVASDNISLDLRAGEIHALIGPNGAGKSTLIQQIAGSLAPDHGRISLLGQDISKAGLSQRARLGLARTFQISELALEDSVLQNVLLGVIGASGRVFRFFRNALKDQDNITQANTALSRVGLLEVAQKPVSTLSHGQRRQLEIAIALTLKPKVLLLDEPMAGLGGSGSKALMPLLETLKSEAPILLVEHDMDAVFALADRISVLVYGKLIATGSVAEIRANREVRTAYLGDEA